MKCETVKLSDVADILVGYPFESKKFNVNGNGVRLVRGKNVTHLSLRWGDDTRWWDDFSVDLSKYNLKENDILIGMDGSLVGRNYAKVKQMDLPCLLVQRVACIRAQSGNDQMFLWGCIASSIFEQYIDSIKTGSTIPHISGKQIGDYEIPAFDFETQKKVGAILKSIDDKIETNKQINDNLEQQAQALIALWFTEYQPFNGVMPSDWRPSLLSEIADFIPGYSYKGNELRQSTTVMASIKNFERGGGFKLDGFKEIIPSDKIKDSQSAKLFDILVAHTDLTQKAEVIGNAEPVLNMAGYDKIVFSMDLVKVVPKAGISQFLLAGLLQDPKFKAHCLGYVNGTTVLHLSKKALPEYELLFPANVETLRPLSDALESIYRKQAAVMEENRSLEVLRDTLLPRLMSGEIDVENVKI